MDPATRLDNECRTLLSRLYRDGTLSKRDLRGPESNWPLFTPKKLANHLQHLENASLVLIEHVKNSHLCKLTSYGESVAAKVIANETGIPVGEKISLLLKEANSHPPPVDDFSVKIAFPSTPSMRSSEEDVDQIKFHRRKAEEPFWRGPGSDLAGVEIRSIIENLGNLSITSVQDANAGLRTTPDPGWQTVQRFTVKLRPPATDPSSNPNDWFQRARRKLELDSTFNRVSTVEVPKRFET